MKHSNHLRHCFYVIIPVFNDHVIKITNYVEMIYHYKHDKSTTLIPIQTLSSYKTRTFYLPFLSLEQAQSGDAKTCLLWIAS